LGTGGTPGRRAGKALFVIATGVLIAYFANNLFTAATAGTSTWTLLDLFPRLSPAGADFLHGMYQPAKELLRTGNPYSLPLYSYPPPVSVLAIPLSLLPFKSAYAIQVVMIFIAAVASVALITDASRRAIRQFTTLSPGTVDLMGVSIGAMSAFLLVTSYGFGFALERGNYDSFALVCSALAIWLMTVDGRRAAIGAIVLIAIASGLKVYPAILFAVVVWRYGWRQITPIVAALVVTLLAAGPANAVRFAGRITDVVSNGVSYWEGNHSAASLAAMMEQTWKIPASATLVPLLVLPVIVWLVGAVLMFRASRTAWGVVAFSALCIPMMSLIPSVSHDYKLVIMYPVLGFVLITAAEWFARTGSARSMTVIVFTLVLSALISRSPNYTAGLLLQNKYAAVLLVECVVLLLIVGGTPRRDPIVTSPNGAA
jgi:hypothetical protein